MSSAIDLGNILSDLGPRFAEAAEENDAGDRFVLENYEALRQSRVFSALVPDEFGDHLRTAWQTPLGDHVVELAEQFGRQAHAQSRQVR